MADATEFQRIRGLYGPLASVLLTLLSGAVITNRHALRSGHRQVVPEGKRYVLARVKNQLELVAPGGRVAYGARGDRRPHCLRRERTRRHHVSPGSRRREVPVGAATRLRRVESAYTAANRAVPSRRAGSVDGGDRTISHLD